MNLKYISVENYKSIEKIEFEIKEINSSFTYSLLGINESGKSSFLNCISLYDTNEINYPNDFFNDSKQVIIKLVYKFSEEDIKLLKKILSDEYHFPKKIISEIKPLEVELMSIFEPTPGTEGDYFEKLLLEKNIFEEYTLKDDIITEKTKNSEVFENDFNINEIISDLFSSYFHRSIHNVVFWKSTPEYLQLDQIDLATFSSNPKRVSIPLRNCFLLAGIDEKEIAKEISKLNTPQSISSLQSKLSKNVTKYINKVWPEHQISILFLIDSNKISLLVEDNGVEYKPKTTGQRSDGFKQFISFLLTISIENHGNKLENTILLLDEPETHLHPQAQVNLLKELIKITSNNNNNIVIFATHSNYLVDKENIERNFKVEKNKNHITTIKEINSHKPTYAEANYEIFQVLANEYHNELYGFIFQEDKNKLDNLEKSKTWTNLKKGEPKKVSLPEYIRNSFHHPENTLNKKYTEKDIDESISILRNIKKVILESQAKNQEIK